MLLIFILCLIASSTRSFLEECGGELRTLKLACCRYITKNTLATIGRVCNNLEGIFCTLGILESVMSLSCSKLCSKFKDFQPCIPFTTALILLMKVLGLKCVHNILLNSSNLHDCNLAVSCLDLLDWHSHNGTVGICTRRPGPPVLPAAQGGGLPPHWGAAVPQETQSLQHWDF